MSDEMRAATPGPSHRTVEVGVALATLTFGILILVGSLEVGVGWGIEGPKPGFFPFYVSLFIVVGSIVNLAQVSGSGGAKRGIFSSWEELRRVLSVLVPTTAYVAIVPFLGMYVSSFLLIGIFMVWLGGYRLWMALPVALGVPIIVYEVFERYFQIALPKGPFEYWLGL